MIKTEMLDELLDRARSVASTPADQEAKRRSFAYGNTHFENTRITREMIDQAAEIIAKSGNLPVNDELRRVGGECKDGHEGLATEAAGQGDGGRCSELLSSTS